TGCRLWHPCPSAVTRTARGTPARPRAGRHARAPAHRPVARARPSPSVLPRPYVATRRPSVPSRAAPSVSRVCLDLLLAVLLRVTGQSDDRVQQVAIVGQQPDRVLGRVRERLTAPRQILPVLHDMPSDALDQDLLLDLDRQRARADLVDV